MFKKSFFNRQSTAVTLLTSGKTPAEIIANARNAEFDGADGVAVDLFALPLEFRTADCFRGIINEVHLPFMFILYRSDLFAGKDDEARQQYLLAAAEGGAEVVDVMGDLYDPSPFELTRNPAAIEKQKKLIEEIHARGAKVIMSSHMLHDFRTPEQILEHLQRQEERGADILKIVTAVNSEDELCEAIRATTLLKRELKTPFVHLAAGSHSRLHRFICPMLGNAIVFACHDYSPSFLLSQPTIRSMKAVMENIHL